MADATNSQRILEDFVVDNKELQQLEILLRKFNIFEALKLVWVEIRHSDFLAYLLDPKQNHGLGDIFLKGFLQSVLHGEVNQPVTPIDIDVWNLNAAEVHREWQNVDILVRDESNQLAIIVENKLQSGEHSDQLARYYKSVSKECPGWKIIPIYLTVENEEPSDKRFSSLGYDRICALVERVVDLSDGMLDRDLRTFMEHYAEMLRRHIMTESEISELCRRIYVKHKQALDLIYEHRPDRLQVVRDLLESWIKGNAELELDTARTKTSIRFIPKRLDTKILRQGSGWTSTGRILLFELVNNPHHLTLRVYVGPGPSEIRQRLFDMALKNQPPFRPKALKLNEKWNSIFAHKLLTSKAYELNDDEFTAELEKQWKRFLEKELPAIVNAIEEQSWIHDPVGAGAL